MLKSVDPVRMEFLWHANPTMSGLAWWLFRDNTDIGSAGRSGRAVDDCWNAARQRGAVDRTAQGDGLDLSNRADRDGERFLGPTLHLVRMRVSWQSCRR